MPRILTTSSVEAVRDIEPSALQPWRFSRLARSISTLAGRPIVFAVAFFAAYLFVVDRLFTFLLDQLAKLFGAA